MSKHLKRLNAPKEWMILRKTSKYIKKPLPGAHSLNESMTINLVLKQLGYAQTSREAGIILNKQEVLVDGRRVRDVKAPVGVLDSIALPASNEYFRIVYDLKGRLNLISIPKTEANSKFSKVVNKTPVKSGKIQYNCSDGRNILADNSAAKTGDTLVLQLPEQKVAQRIALEKGAMIYLLGGKHIGRVGVLKEIANDEISLTADGQSISTAKRHALVVGKEKPVLKITQ